MPYAYTLTAKIPATPEEIYQAWLDSIGHSEMTGSQATMSDQVGAEVSAWDGYISGRNLELVPGERIVQSWRTSEFDDEHEDSVITIVLEPADEGTLLTLEHSNVPDEQRSYEEGGWHSNYFEPMIAYFSELSEEEGVTVPEPKEMPRRSASERRAKKATSATAGRARKAASTKPPKRPAKSVRGGKPASGAKKSARGASRAKPAPKRSKSKTKSRAAAARTKRSAAKTRRGKRR